MTRTSLRHTMNHRDLLGLFRSSHRKCSVKNYILKISQISQQNIVLESLFNNVAGFQEILQHGCFPMKFAKFLRTPILKNICERLLLFVSPQNTLTNSGGEFRLAETLTECNVNIFFKCNDFIQSNAAV